MVYVYLIMVPKLHIFNYQYRSTLFILLLDIVLVFSNIIIYLTPKPQFLINSKQTNPNPIFTLIQSIYSLQAFLNESVSISHFLFVFVSINYVVLLFYLPLEHLPIWVITQEQIIHLPLIIDMIFIYKLLEFNQQSHQQHHLLHLLHLPQRLYS